MILIVVKHPVRPQHADAWPSLMKEFTAATRASRGTSRSIGTEADDPNLWVLIETFRDGAAGKAHVDSPHFQAAISLLPQLLSGVPEIINVEVPGTEWARMSELQVDQRS